MIDAAQKDLSSFEFKPSDYHKDSGGGYYDDYCLAKFLEGVCCRFCAFPDPDSVDAKEVIPDERVDYTRRAREAFEEVIKFGPKIELDHYLVYHTRKSDLDGQIIRFLLMLPKRLRTWATDGARWRSHWCTQANWIGALWQVAGGQ